MVLPLLGQGWPGNNQLPSAGIIYFFCGKLDIWLDSGLVK